MRSAVVCLFAAAAVAQTPPATTVPTTPPPRLVVLCSVDQLAAWVFDEALPHLPEHGGFRRLLRDGVRFAHCAYEHACTETGPGHATIGTGTPARAHGIVRNKWWVPGRRTTVYCVEEAVPPLPDLPEGRNRGPGLLMAPTLAELLRQGVPGSRSGSVAWKDRAAILMAGPRADVAVWCEASTGCFVTNTVYAAATPAWLAAFNGSRPLDGFHGQVWARSGPDSAYAGLVDDRPYETPHGNGSGGRSLPQPVTGGLDAPGPAFYAQLYTSPFGNTAVRLAAEAMVRGMGLGADDVPDLLCVGFSSTDVIGHAFGPDSVEARDGLLRLDRDLEALLAFLDLHVGTGRWAMFLTADHGICPTPEWSREQGRNAGRGLIQTMVQAAAEKAVAVRLGPPPTGRRYVAHVGEFSIAFDDESLLLVGGGRDLAAVRRDAAEAAAAAARKVRGIAAAFPTEELLAAGGAGDPLRKSLVDALFPGRAGDVQLVIQPYWLDGATPASHGTPHAYDRQVVGIATGPGVPRGASLDAPITPGFGAVWFAAMLGLPRPPHATDVLPPGFGGP